MATFSEEELEDQVRIEIGYDRFATTSVPFGLEPGFGSLAKAIAARDRYYGTSTPKRFSVLDGVSAVVQGQPSVKAVELLEKLVEGQTRNSESISPGEMLDQLVERSKEQNANEQATFYVLSNDKTKIIGTINLKGHELTIEYASLKYTSTEWERSIFPDINAEPTESFRRDSKGRSEEILFAIDQMFENLDCEVVVETDYEQGSYTARYDAVFMVDGGVFKDEMLQILADSSRERTLEDGKAREMCLMMTQDWLQPAFEYSDNVPSWATLRSLASTSHSVEGNCVEQSIANAINSNGGLNGELVFPRYRVLPSVRALTRPEPIFHLDDLDPFSEQTLSKRLYGLPSDLQGNYDIDQQGISEVGATVSVPGHQFFVRKDGGSIDVYDTAMRFCGPSELYFNFLEARGIATALKSVSHCCEIDPGRSKFVDVCREPYRAREIYDRTKEIFQELVPSTRDLDGLYGAWNQALGENPGHIARSLKIDGQDSGIQIADRTSGKAEKVGSVTLDEMLLSQEKGFVCFLWPSEYMNYDAHMTLFKDGDDIFFSAGRDSAVLDASRGKIFGDQKGNSYEVVSYGGNNIELMDSMHKTGIEKHADSIARLQNGRDGQSISY